MLAEVYNTEIEAINRERELYNLTKNLFKGDKYCEIFKHPTLNKWAVPYMNVGRLKVNGNGATLTSDWFKKDLLF